MKISQKIVKIICFLLIIYLIEKFKFKYYVINIYKDLITEDEKNEKKDSIH